MQHRSYSVMVTVCNKRSFAVVTRCGSYLGKPVERPARCKPPAPENASSAYFGVRNFLRSCGFGFFGQIRVCRLIWIRINNTFKARSRIFPKSFFSFNAHYVSWVEFLFSIQYNWTLQGAILLFRGKFEETDNLLIIYDVEYTHICQG